jgi:hypothetical protein
MLTSHPSSVTAPSVSPVRLRYPPTPRLISASPPAVTRASWVSPAARRKTLLGEEPKGVRGVGGRPTQRER